MHALAAILTVKRLLQGTHEEMQKEFYPLPSSLLEFDGEIIWDNISKVKINAFTVCDGLFTPLGLGMYPIACSGEHVLYDTGSTHGPAPSWIGYY